MDERRVRVLDLLASLTDEQVRLVEDYARHLKDLEVARQAYHALEELWKSRPRREPPRADAR